MLRKPSFFLSTQSKDSSRNSKSGPTIIFQDPTPLRWSEPAPLTSFGSVSRETDHYIMVSRALWKAFRLGSSTIGRKGFRKGISSRTSKCASFNLKRLALKTSWCGLRRHLSSPFLSNFYPSGPLLQLSFQSPLLWIPMTKKALVTDELSSLLSLTPLPKEDHVPQLARLWSGILPISKAQSFLVQAPLPSSVGPSEHATPTELGD